MTSRTTSNGAPRIPHGTGNLQIPAVVTRSRSCATSLRATVKAGPKAPTDTRVLIVDDEPQVRLVLERILEKSGYRCTLAGSMREGRGFLESQPFDLMLCDLMMPDESGFTLLAYASTMHPELAVLIVSGMNTAEVAEPAASAGADGYIMKPFNANTILINIVGALRRRATLFETMVQRNWLETGIRRLESELHVRAGTGELA